MEKMKLQSREREKFRKNGKAKRKEKGREMFR